jgi:hypothetical protein
MAPTQGVRKKKIKDTMLYLLLLRTSKAPPAPAKLGNSECGPGTWELSTSNLFIYNVWQAINHNTQASKPQIRTLKLHNKQSNSFHFQI